MDEVGEQISQLEDQTMNLIQPGQPKTQTKENFNK